MNVLTRVVALAPVAAFAVACSAANPAATLDHESSGAPRAGAALPTAAALGVKTRAPRILPIQRVSRAPAATPRVSATDEPQKLASGSLTYRGGPVLANVKVVTVFWNSHVQFQAQLNQFYTDVPNSTYYDWLKEYNTPSQTIGRGGLGGTAVDPRPPSSTSIEDADIQTEVGRLIDAHTIPAPDGNTLYMVYFPPGVDISMQGQGSCQVFCAYHGSFTHGGKNVYYGVMPDQGGNCAGGCGGASSLFDNTTSVSSHELVEATTDADVGQDHLAWYDDSNGEIGDICNAEQGTVAVGSTTYTVQKEWSNAQRACVTTGGGGTCTPHCSGKTCGSDGCGGSCGTCASGQSCGTDGACHGGGTCTPTCANDGTCGSDDGCGGTCGCADGSTCQDGYCW